MFVTYRIGFCYSSSQCELVLGPKGSKWVEARTGTYWNGCKYAEFSAPSPVGQPLRYDVGCVWTTCSSSLPLERFSYDLEMKTREQNRNNKRVRTAIWLVYRTDTNARGFWLVKRTLGWKNFMPENFLEINRYFALTSYCNTTGQSNSASPY